MPTPANVQNYAIGKGILYIGEWSGNTPPTDPAGYEDMGNVTSIEIEPTVERLPHYSSRSGFRTKDRNPVIQTEYAIRFDADEMAAVNLNHYLLGTRYGADVQALMATDKEYALKFISDNPIGPNQTWRCWKATLMPNGPLQLIGEEYMMMSFAGEGLADVANHSTSPYITVTYVTTTTTTTTTTT
jgi:hypothetical protein